MIVNLHLLGADLRSGGAVLPEHDVLVVDEAHELEDVLAACLGVDVSPGRLRGVAVGARAVLGGAAAGSSRRSSKETSNESASEGVLNAAVRFEQALNAARDKRLPPGLGPDVGDAVQLAVSRLVELERELRTASTNDGSGGNGAEAAADAGQRGLRSLLATERCRLELESCLTAGRDEVVWVTGGVRLSLKSAPLDVSPILAAQVFSQMPVVLTSATLPPGLAERLGAPTEDVTELDVGSPFDYRQHGLVYCAVHLPDRRRPDAESAIHDELEMLVRAARGRTLGLFTSYRAMQAAAEALRPRIPWPVHVPGLQLGRGGVSVRDDGFLAGRGRAGTDVVARRDRPASVSSPGRAPHGRQAGGSGGDGFPSGGSAAGGHAPRSGRRAPDPHRD